MVCDDQTAVSFREDLLAAVRYSDTLHVAIIGNIGRLVALDANRRCMVRHPTGVNDMANYLRHDNE